MYSLVSYSHFVITPFAKSFWISKFMADSGAHLAGGVQGIRTTSLYRYSPNFALKFLNQFSRNALKNQFKKQKNPSKRCTNSILLKFFKVTLTSARQKNAELIFEKLHLICKLTFANLSPWQLFSIFHSACYPIFVSFTIFNSTIFENLKTILFYFIFFIFYFILFYFSSFLFFFSRLWIHGLLGSLTFVSCISVLRAIP